MLRFIEKHKIFIVLILALISMLMGFSFVLKHENSIKESGAGDEKFIATFSYKAQWCHSYLTGNNPDGWKTGNYVSIEEEQKGSDGERHVYKGSIGSVKISGYEADGGEWIGIPAPNNTNDTERNDFAFEDKDTNWANASTETNIYMFFEATPIRGLYSYNYVCRRISWLCKWEYDNRVLWCNW